MKALRWGQPLFCRMVGIVATVWKDKKLVSLLSSQCEVWGNRTVSQKQKDDTIIQVPTVPVVQLYNKYMGGVECSRPAKKRWRYLLWFCMDVCVVNAEVDNFPNFTQLQIRFELVKMLIGNLNFTSQKQNVLDGAVNANHWPVPMTKGRCKRCLKNGKTTFCLIGCKLCGLRLCLACFKVPGLKSTCAHIHSYFCLWAGLFICSEQYTFFFSVSWVFMPPAVSKTFLFAMGQYSVHSRPFINYLFIYFFPCTHAYIYFVCSAEFCFICKILM